jgi:hypothetical protein
MVRNRTRPGPLVPANADIRPTPERTNHGLVERVERAIGDASGRPGRPYRFVDTLAVMERRGSITPGMRQAGEDFRDRFAIAQLDPLRAFDLSRPRIGNRAGFRSAQEPGSRIEDARTVVWGCDRCCRRSRFRGRLLSMACRRMATVPEGMGARTGLERPAGEPGSGFRDPDRFFGNTRSAFRSIEALLIKHFGLTIPD